MTVGRGFRDRFQVPVADEELAKVPFIRLPEDGPEMKYFRAQREKLGFPGLRAGAVAAAEKLA